MKKTNNSDSVGCLPVTARRITEKRNVGVFGDCSLACIICISSERNFNRSRWRKLARPTGTNRGFSRCSIRYPTGRTRYRPETSWQCTANTRSKEPAGVERKQGARHFGDFSKLPFTERPPPQKIRVVIVSPALADANNSNSQTARRWLKTAAFSSTTLVYHSG